MGNNRRTIREIAISNLGVIASATIELDNGFNVLTGETGAGKTMILTALGLLAGEKGDTDFIRSGSERLSVSVILQAEKQPSGNLRDLLAEQEPEMEEGSLILTRSISRDGKNRAQVGGDVTTVGSLAKFAQEFYVIHGQGTNQKLRSNEHQRKLIDQSDHILLEKISQLSSGVGELRKIIRERDDFKVSLRGRDETKRRLDSFVSEFAKVAPRPGEYEDIDARIRQLDSVEKWQLALNTAKDSLDHEESGILTGISRAVRALGSIGGSESEVSTLSNRLENSRTELSDIRDEITSLLGRLESEPGEIDRLRERKATLNSFMRKHGEVIEGASSPEEQIGTLIEHAKSVDLLLSQLEDGDVRLHELETMISKLFEEMFGLAHEISSLRRKIAKRVEAGVAEELRMLGLDGAIFTIDVEAIEVKEPQDLPMEGIDEVSFKFAAHQSITPHPLTKGISGGELSRLMLAIELSLVSEHNQAAIIFDEVDSGIGGETANIVGERLSRLARQHQIIVVTHLPQVAVWAEHHFVIAKSADEQYVQSSVRRIDGHDRAEEIARMLSGEVENEAALSHARSLLKHASSK